MAAVRSCVCLLVVLVHLQVAVSKPFFDWLWCDMVCDDDDITATTTSTTANDDIFGDMFSFDCSDCPQPARATTARPAQSIALRLPGAPNGISMNVTDNNGVLQFVLDAITSQAGQAMNMAAGPATQAPAGNGTAGNGTTAGR